MSKPLVSVDCSELKDLAKQLGEFFDPSVAKPSPLGKAVAAGARHAYLELERVTPINEGAIPTDSSGKPHTPGTLRKSVYRYWNPALSPNGNKIVYSVGVNMSKAPHWHLADGGHKFYRNYLPMKVKRTPVQYRSRKKDRAIPLGDVVFKARGNHYLDRAFAQTVLKHSLDIIVDVYMDEFKRAMARK